VMSDHLIFVEQYLDNPPVTDPKKDVVDRMQKDLPRQKDLAIDQSQGFTRFSDPPDSSRLCE
jgi:hypothetical protein